LQVNNEFVWFLSILVSLIYLVSQAILVLPLFSPLGFKHFIFSSSLMRLIVSLTGHTTVCSMTLANYIVNHHH
jgi:hypothetical protein